MLFVEIISCLTVIVNATYLKAQSDESDYFLAEILPSLCCFMVIVCGSKTSKTRGKSLFTLTHATKRLIALINVFVF